MPCGVARAAGVEVESEEGIRFTHAEREATHGADWIARHVDSMVTSVIAHTRSLDEGYITMPGTTRDFHLGPRVLAEIDEGDVAAQREALFAKMRALFYPDPEEVYPANVLSVTRDDGSRVTLTAFARDVPYIFPPVQYLTVLDDEPFEIPFDALEAVVGEDRIVWMDEVCPAVEAIGPLEWPAVVALARAHAVDAMARRPSTPAERISHAPDQPKDSGGVPWGLVIGVLIAFAVVAYVLSR